MHDSTTEDEVFAEFIFEVRTEEALALHRERTLALQLHIHVRAGLQDRSVENRHGSHRIIDGVVHVLYQRCTACRHGHRTAWHVHRPQTNLAAVRSFVTTRQAELILLAVFLRHH